MRNAILGNDLKYTHFELEIKNNLQKQVKIRVSRKPQVPRFFFKDLHYKLVSLLVSRFVLFYRHAMFMGNSQKEARYLSSPVYRCPVYAQVKENPDPPPPTLGYVRLM